MVPQKLVKTLHAIVQSWHRRSEARDPVDILKTDYRDQLRLSEQIYAHAERAPYPHVALRLRQIAMEKRKSADILKEKILSLGGTPDEPHLQLDSQPSTVEASSGRSLELKSGKNHWERMSRDLEDQKALETRFLEHAVLLGEKAPEISELLQRIVAGEGLHKETLSDLIARADPQADQS